MLYLGGVRPPVAKFILESLCSKRGSWAGHGQIRASDGIT